MDATLRKYLDLESQLDKLARGEGSPNFKELTIVPAVDILAKVTTIIVEHAIDPAVLVKKFAQLRGEEEGKNLYLKDGLMATRKMIQGSTILLAAAHELHI